MTVDTSFEDERPAPSGEELVLDLGAYEGPIDVLLALARQQKVDLAALSILKLADQYLAFIATARRLRLEVAADYLVMAAWLAYLKSRLLLPEQDTEEETGAPEMIEALTFQLRRLEAIREAGEQLMSLPQLGRHFFLRGAPEGVEIVRTPVYQLTLYELLKAYGDQRKRVDRQVLQIEPSSIHSMDRALTRLRNIVGHIPEWSSLESLLPEEALEGVVGKSAVASTLAACLELVREGRFELRQSKTFGPIFVRSGGAP